MSDKKYIVMSKFDSSDKFIYDRGFATRQLANSYAKLMMDSNFYFDVPFKKDNQDDDGVPF